MAAAAAAPAWLPVHSAGEGAVALLPPAHVFVDVASSSTAAPASAPAETRATHLIFLVDASASMIDIWPAVAAAINRVTAVRQHAHVLKWATVGTVRSSPLVADFSDCAMVDSAAGMGTGFSTNLAAAARVLADHLRTLVARGARRFFVIFVSDGDGDEHGLDDACATARATVDAVGGLLELTVLGVGAAFPTAVAMRIRAALHSGRPSIPPLAIVGGPDDMAPALASLEPHYRLRWSTVQLPRRVARATPWGAPTDLLTEGVVYLLPADTTTLRVSAAATTASADDGDGDHTTDGRLAAGVDYPLRLVEWTEPTLATAAKQWSWALQVASLDGDAPDAADAPSDGTSGRKVVAARATSALRIFDAAAAPMAAAAATRAVADCRVRVAERVRRQAAARSRHMLATLGGELRRLASGHSLAGLSDVEMAQRLAIGTMEGKHHAAALSWKGLDADAFGARRDSFLRLLANPAAVAAVAAAASAEEAAGLRSAVSLEGNADVLSQPDLATAVAAVSSQYFLVDVLPLVGLAVRVGRTSAGMINPWALRVDATALHTPVLDTASLVALSAAGEAAATEGGLRASRGVVASLSTGGDSTETVNAVVAVVADSASAAAMRPFLTSPLYQLLHTYTACGNADTADAVAHPALLSATVCYLLGARHAAAAAAAEKVTEAAAAATVESRTASGEGRGEGRAAATAEPARPFSEALSRLLLTLRELYPRLEKYVHALAAAPTAAVVTAHASLATTCAGMTKPLALSLAWRDRLADTPCRRAAVSAVVREWVARAIGTYRRSVSEWFSLRDPVVTLTATASGETIDDVAAAVAALHPPVTSYYTIREAVTAATVTPPVIPSVTHAGVDVNRTALWAARDGGVTLAAVEEWARELLGDRAWAVGDEELAAAAAAALRATSSYDRYCRSPADAAADVAWVQDQLERSATASAVAAASDDITAAVTASWRGTVAAAHAGAGAAMPRSWAALTAARHARPHPHPADRLDGRGGDDGDGDGGGDDGSGDGSGDTTPTAPAWTPATAGYRPAVGFTARACTAPGCPWYLVLVPRHQLGHHIADTSELPLGGATALSIATAAAVRRNVTDPTALANAVVGGAHLQFPSTAKARSLAAIADDDAAMAQLTQVVVAQAVAYRELFGEAAHEDRGEG
ncbi:hypothetical protein MMPV_009002 [Pyropia vietnamensis]